MDLPLLFEKEMRLLLQDKYTDFIDAYDQPRYFGLRVNPLKVGADFPDKMAFELRKIPWCHEGYYYQEEERPGKDAYYMAGCYYIQEPSAMMVGRAVDAKPGDKIIDLCAAPGGKTTHIAGMMDNRGLIVSNDISPSRVRHLSKNIQISGIRNCVVTSEDPKVLARAWPGYFDKVLVDAPCSGEGMFRKDPKLIKSWEESGPDDFVPIQRSILASAHRLLKNGGTLTYSTCTFNMKENEYMVAAFLKEYPQYELLELERILPVSDGFSINGSDACLKRTKRLWPHLFEGEGHFVAKMIKKDVYIESNVHVFQSSIHQEAKAAFLNFAESIGYEPEEGIIDALHQHVDKIFCMPKEAPKTQGLRVFSSGWLLGTYQKKRFEPSQALASALKPDQVRNKIMLSHDDINVTRYLKGETLSIDVENGWYLICVDVYSLGWGKVVNHKLKNKIEASWRWL
ncbi:RsmB/NOP family class I SAM-dependent RNA methyltransferase [Petrocella sp. FN5]|uniref:RsmB/NOP family class I SAM-dependent RNA methyltransferase n=1 Tax=Petrocella sp. FN5 TaxID=3032002 RepID=UPI0023DB6BC7|nr:RsmB/NOP family class I SAM-dependent RNA methyltransferase [Petrocella sp. FN5]MDF1617001.1 RsmB/NOP family class I SAM-dependent RNA methyltransferase [Petrocella sp. FN5]